eukprot:5255059-Pyramimonas_sp.AAC.1
MCIRDRLRGAPTTKIHALSENSLGGHPGDLDKRPRGLPHTIEAPTWRRGAAVPWGSSHLGSKGVVIHGPPD